ncbi:hypothetical protein DAMA08_039600 [Martiniozyma asiatica (nom. inval.)]|nr:hypothetical protein DAMA08_039600 [Martiniozyma asiatica]
MLNALDLTNKDPLTASRFYLLDLENWIICRPICEHVSIGNRKYKIFNALEEAPKSAFPCIFCLPDKIKNIDKSNLKTYSCIDIQLVKKTILYVNKSCGFKPFQVEDPNNSGKNYSVLSDIACRHLACAAMSSFGIVEVSPVDIESENGIRYGDFVFNFFDRKTKRGGVISFKTLGSLFNLSPWHFHREFKKIVGITGREYGDRCREFILKNISVLQKRFKNGKTIIISSSLYGKRLTNEISYKHKGKNTPQKTKRRATMSHLDSNTELVAPLMNISASEFATALEITEPITSTSFEPNFLFNPNYTMSSNSHSLQTLSDDFMLTQAEQFLVNQLRMQSAYCERTYNLNLSFGMEETDPDTIITGKITNSALYNYVR